MTDHNFTDEEIVKALECCADTTKDNCVSCPCKEKGLMTGDVCIPAMSKAALALINRQKAEIEELEKIKQNSLEIISIGEKQILEVGAKYIKEFAERVKAKSYLPHPSASVRAVFTDDIDLIAKEMTEGGRT